MDDAFRFSESPEQRAARNDPALDRRSGRNIRSSRLVGWRRGGPYRSWAYRDAAGPVKTDPERSQLARRPRARG
jgi:hypothetical protein